MDKETYEALKKVMSKVYEIGGKDIEAFTYSDVEQVELWMDEVSKDYEDGGFLGDGGYIMGLPDDENEAKQIKGTIKKAMFGKKLTK